MERDGEFFRVSVPIVAMDDASFLAYCEAIGAQQRTDGAVIRNLICDVTNPDFRHPQYMPYINDCRTTVLAAQKDGAAAAEMLISDGTTVADGDAVSEDGVDAEMAVLEIPVLACTEEVPVLREEYATIDKYELVHFVPASLWRKMEEGIGGAEKDTFIRILCRKGSVRKNWIRFREKLKKVLQELT